MASHQVVRPLLCLPKYFFAQSRKQTTLLYVFPTKWHGTILQKNWLNHVTPGGVMVFLVGQFQQLSSQTFCSVDFGAALWALQWQAFGAATPSSFVVVDHVDHTLELF